MSLYSDTIAAAVCYYPLQETSGTSFADERGGPAATCAVDASVMATTGPTPWLPVAQAIQASGNNWIRRAGLNFTGPPYTIALWARCRDAALVNRGFASLHAGGGDYTAVQYRTTAEARFEARDGSSGSVYVPHAASLGEDWHYYAAVVGATEQRMHVDDDYTTTNFTVGTEYGEASDFLIGGFRLASGAMPFDVAGAAAFDYALSPAEIAALYAGPPTTADPWRPLKVEYHPFPRHPLTR